MPDGVVNEVLLPGVKAVGLRSEPSAIEDEVVCLFDRYRDPLLRYVHSLGLPLHDGEEIIQEVFLALYRHLRGQKSRRNLPGWIFSVAHNLALKQRQVNQRSEDRLNLESETAQGLADRSPNPEAQALYRERQGKLLAVVQTLPEKDQWCLWLRAEGLRYREIAGVLGISLGSVASSLARTLARLMWFDQR